MANLNVGTLFGYLELDDQLTPALRLAGTQMDAAGKKLETLGAGVSKLGSALLPMSVAITAGSAASLMFSANFEASMTRLVSLAGVGADEIAGVREEILKMAPAVGIGPQALADAMTKISSTVSDTKTAMSILNIAAQGTKAGFGETIDVAGALTTVLNSYGAANITAARAGDILAMAVKEGGAEAKELAPVLANVVPFAAQLGVSFEEVAANIATMTKLGVPTTEAVTSLTSVFSALTKETKQGTDALASLGMSYAGIREEIREKGLAATLTMLQERFGDNVPVLMDVFGRIEAVKNIMGTAGVQADTYAEVLGEVKRSSDGASGSMKGMADAMSGKTVQNWNELTATIKVLAIEFGDRLAPALGKVVDLAKPVLNFAIDSVEWFGKLPQPLQMTAVGFLAVGAALGPLLLAAGTFISAFGVVSGVGGTLLGVAGAAAKVAAPLAVAEGAIITAGGAAVVTTGSFGLFARALGALLGPIGLAVTAAWGLYEVLSLLPKTGTDAERGMVAFKDGLRPMTEAELAARDAAADLGKRLGDIELSAAGAAQAVVGLTQPLKVLTEEQQKVENKIRDLTVGFSGLTRVQIAEIESLTTLGLTAEDVATKLGLSAAAVDKVTTSLKEQKAASDALLAISDQLLGVDDLKRATDYAEAIRGAGIDISALSTASQAMIADVARAGIEYLSQTGQLATSELTQVFADMLVKATESSRKMAEEIRLIGAAADQTKDSLENLEFYRQQDAMMPEAAPGAAGGRPLGVVPTGPGFPWSGTPGYQLPTITFPGLGGQPMMPTTPTPGYGGGAGSTVVNMSGMLLSNNPAAKEEITQWIKDAIFAATAGNRKFSTI